MPVLLETEYKGDVVWAGATPADGGVSSTSSGVLTLGFHGLLGERHQGENRASCVRVSNLYPQGTTIRNVRQLSILSEEELALIAADMGLEQVDPGALGANLVLRGIPDFTYVPPSSRLQGPDGVTLTVDMENRPCIFPGREIEKTHKGFGPKFKPAAGERRGITAWVERPGQLKIGDSLRLFVPDQRVWAP
ncbi:MOSC domain-containing protein [Pseudophaeobacter flagellatus]|uniref:MOSC domain-containing protein n=1 Tax=Pseudophaeobacter flagellatus TaxID=2899119 RepID=UPI001E62D5E1|nr:MOSC domain-containing protein [Pseudophaeobacter flagellatus]MCD9148406.1 sulfurase [Pseudophaeobacter flagellatus]